MKITEGKNTHYSIFNRFISLIFLVFISLVLFIGWKVGNISKKFAQENLVYVAHNINQNLNNIFNYTEDNIRFMSNLIAEQALENDYYQIFHLLQLFSQDPKKQLTPWNAIGWADANHIVRVNSTEILKSPVDLSYRPYSKNLATKAFTLTFCKPDASYINKSRIIPAAMGVKNKEGVFLGSIITGINIQSIKAHVDKLIESDHLYYALVNAENNELIFHSTDFNEEHYQELSKNLQQMNKDKIEQKFHKINNRNYVINTFPNFPFAIVVGANQTIIGYKEYFQSLAPYKLELLAGLLIISILIYLFYYSILDPFLALSEVAFAISNGDTSTPMPNNVNSKEGALVANALEKIKASLRIEKGLVQELSDAHNKLSMANLKLENKVTERTRELEQVLLNKTIFLDQLSHEIKMPLQGVTNIAENLISFWNELTESMRFEFSHQIAHNTHRLLSLVNNLLDLSKYANGNIQLKLDRLNLTELVEEIIAECKILYMHKKTVIINFNNNQPVYMMGDREKITQVLRNLFVNAINHSSNNSFIAAKIITTKNYDDNDHEQEAVHFILCDRGDGIKEEEIALIFSPLAEAKSTDNVKLGLKICHKIITAHHGKIWAFNNKDGGATFNFVLPVSQAASSLEDKKNPPSYRDLSHNKHNVLIIDDEEICLGGMELLLHETKYNLIKCDSGQAGLKYLQQHHKVISVIMLDLMMPDMYGLNVLAEIKNNPDLMNIPVILQTGSSDEEEIVKAFNMGAVSFIRKPYKKKIVLSEISKAIRLYNLNTKDEPIDLKEIKMVS